ncbi:hypothetical protein WS63_27515 [Burkholderia stagnalis]|nr:hypothetical protein WS63_27515 [Burkholderia stagnalis]
MLLVCRQLIGITVITINDSVTSDMMKTLQRIKRPYSLNHFFATSEWLYRMLRESTLIHLQVMRALNTLHKQYWLSAPQHFQKHILRYALRLRNFIPVKTRPIIASEAHLRTPDSFRRESQVMGQINKSTIRTCGFNRIPKFSLYRPMQMHFWFVNNYNCIRRGTHALTNKIECHSLPVTHLSGCIFIATPTGHRTDSARMQNKRPVRKNIIPNLLDHIQLSFRRINSYLRCARLPHILQSLLVIFRKQKYR